MKYNVGDMVIAIGDDGVEPSHRGKFGIVIRANPDDEFGGIYEVLFQGCRCKDLRQPDMPVVSCGNWEEFYLRKTSLEDFVGKKKEYPNRWKNLALQTDPSTTK